MTDSPKNQLWKDALVLLTLAALVAACWLLWGAGFFRPGGRYPRLEELNQVGGFLGGLLAPVVLAWAARGYYLQRQQLIESMAAMKQQVDLQVEANQMQRREVMLLQDQQNSEARAEFERTAPRVSLSMHGVSEQAEFGIHQLRATNMGARCFGLRMVIKTADASGEIVVVRDVRLDVQVPHGEGVDLNTRIDNFHRRMAERDGYLIDLELRRADDQLAKQRFTADSRMQNIVQEQFLPATGAVWRS